MVAPSWLPWLVSLLLVGSFLNSSAAQSPLELVSIQGRENLGFYLELAPRGKASHLLVLIPGFGQGAETVFPETRLINIATQHDIHTVVVNNDFRLYPDRSYQRYLNRVIQDALLRHRIPVDQVAIGGFSAGGTIALRYVERALANPSAFPCVPAAVFTADAPVDLEELWYYCEREVERNYSPAGISEARFVLDHLREKLNGSPEEAPERYAQHSPFLRRMDSLGQERYLRLTPVRCYHDLDVSWQLKNRQRTLYDNNAAPASELILQLQRAGNQQAEFILADTPAYRANGERHPHAWSVINEVDCINWLLAAYREQVEKRPGAPAD